MEKAVTCSYCSYSQALCWPWVHYDKEPASVVADSKGLPKLENKSDYDAAKGGWYYGPGCFYGSDKIATVNIKILKSSKPRLIRIAK